MKTLYLIFILISLVQCNTKVDSLNGRYTSITKYPDGRYETLDILDSLVLVDRIVLGSYERDTIVIDPRTKKFVQVTPKSMFPIFDFRTIGDTIEVHYEDDLGQGKIKFIKATQL